MKQTQLALSAHFDDAVFSIGGTIAENVGKGQEFYVGTIFTGSPATNVRFTLAALELHWRCGGGTNLVRKRCAENVDALAQLGASAKNCGLLDAVYRTTVSGDAVFKNVDDIFADFPASESRVVNRVAEWISNLCLEIQPAHIYVPLGAGGHIDHRIVRLAAERIWTAKSRGFKLWFYEDVPYAFRERYFGWKKRLCDDLSFRIVRLSEQAWSAKMTASAAYASQVQMLWGSRSCMEEEMFAYAVSIGCDTPAERLWS